LAADGASVADAGAAPFGEVPAAELTAATGAAAASPAEKPVEKLPVLKEGQVALDAEKIKLFHATQLLRDSPGRLRERFDLPLQASRSKRPRLSAGGAAGAPLSIEEFSAAHSALTGIETTIEELCKIVGDRMYIDEMEGAVHTMDITTLPQEPRERLKRLFELSSHWNQARLASLMSPTVLNAKIDVWLLKYCRVVYVEFEKGKEVKLLTKKFAGLG